MDFIQYYKILKKSFQCQLYMESPSVLEIKSKSNIETFIKTLKEIAISDIFDCFGDSLSISFFGSSYTSVTINADSLEQLDEQLDLVSANPKMEGEISIKINKKKFQAVFFKDISFSPTNAVLLLTFFEDKAASAFFDEVLQKIEKAIYPEGQFKRLLIFLPSIHLEPDKNEYSMIIGLNYKNNADMIKDFCSKAIDHDEIGEIISQRDLYCNWVNPTKILIPDMFWFKKLYSELITFKNHEISVEEKTIMSLCNSYLKLFLAYISNYTTDTNYKIIGYRTLDFPTSDNLANDLNPNALEHTFNLISFIYSGQTQDKLTITRNSVSVNVHQTDNINKMLSYIPDIFNSVQNSFNLYMGKKLEEFLDKKLELEKHARETAKEISDEISNSINLISRNLIAFIGTSLVGFLGYITRGNIFLLWTAAAAYSVFVVISTSLFAIYSKNKKDHVVDVYEHYSKINHYVDKDSKEKFNKEIVRSREKLFGKYWVWSIVINLFLILFIFVLAFVISNNFEAPTSV
ncbi:hypothetical protein ACFWGC_28565 [Cytobacillus pseudoceanisediminis]|uniref:hypothetical protein n=1 Tax=Cytobacillus pseudoceanisediminis TaxID=3051614 RepID=UPI0036554389